MTRNGKIAQIPPVIREQLNTRLRDGEEGESLLTWLNGLRSVQLVLKEQFEGVPISKQNLSEWRQGGFREWQLREDLIDHACTAWDSGGELDKFVDTSLLAGRLATLITARYAALLNNWDGEPDPKLEEKLRLLRWMTRDVALLQRTIHQANRQKREQEKATDEEERKDLQLEKDRMVAPILARIESEAVAATMGGGERNQKIADFLTGTKYNLTKEIMERTAPFSNPKPADNPKSQTQSNPVAVKPAKSKPVSPVPVGRDSVEP
jgi:hypothetical protein